MSDQNALVKLSVDQFVRTSSSRQRKKSVAQKLAKKYGPILDHFSDVVFITDEEGYFVFVNKASEQRTGIPIFISSNLIDLWGKKIIQGIFRDISKEKMISDLKGELEARKLINRAKAIIANHYKINDSDAMRLLQKESRKQSRKLQEVAQAVISSKFILD